MKASLSSSNIDNHSSRYNYHVLLLSTTCSLQSVSCRSGIVDRSPLSCVLPQNEGCRRSERSLLLNSLLPVLALPADVQSRETPCVALGTCPPQPQNCAPSSRGDPSCGTFERGTIGDSWDSGVAYSDAVAYDDNADNCLRIKYAYGAQMESDASWTKGKQNSTSQGVPGRNLLTWSRTMARYRKQVVLPLSS